MSSQPEPAPKPAKPRLLQDGRDMFWSLGPLVVACILLAGLVGMCSFQPSGVHNGPVPDYDADAALHADAAALGFPIRLPRLPADWQPNSGSRGSIESGRTDPENPAQRLRAVTSTVGYLTPTGQYLGLTQSNADEEKLVGSLVPATHPTGTADVDGTTWVIYQGPEVDRAEPVWTTRLGGGSSSAQVAITGAGTPDEFHTLAAATQSRPPLPVNG
ncbi:MAG TPA: DUF4245 domain-containing protein [Mycobacterium sp.]|nr:DUF4245 domain-containing protein [Mycobacterium sp.]